MGACVRVAAAADAAGVLTTGTHDPWHPGRAAGRRRAALRPAGRAAGWDGGDRAVVSGRCSALDPDGAPFDARALPPRSVLAFGTERHGLSDELTARAQQLIRIPMRDGVSSLNLATAVAAVLFSWRTATAGRGRSVTVGRRKPTASPAVGLSAAAAVALLAFWATVVLALARSAAAGDGRATRRSPGCAPSPLDDRLGVVDDGAVVEHQRRAPCGCRSAPGPPGVRWSG